MKRKICYIVGAGDNYGLDFEPRSDDYVIAADGGLRYLEQNAIAADLVIGDFDTLQYTPQHSNVIALSTEKDDTDMLAAIREGIKAGYDTFHIYCGTGGRIEHTIANIQLLAFLSQQERQGFLFNKDTIITAITNQTMPFSKCMTGYVSVFSYAENAQGVYLKGLKYELENATLTNTFPVGVSNEFIGVESTITVKNGTLLIVYPKSAKEK